MNSDLEDRQKFRNKEYWEGRFNDEQKSSENTGEEPYEWFSKYADFSDIITKISPPENTKTILVLGCGNSSLSFDLLTDYKNTIITSHDYSSTVINHMRNKYKNEKRLKWEVHDCRKIPNTEDKYDFIIEKAVLDALVAGSKSPWPDTMDAECRDFVRDTKNSVIPALVEDADRRGKFISISFAGPMLRGMMNRQLRIFLKSHVFYSRWGISKHTFNSSIGLFEYYIYECTIGAPDDPDIVPKEVESRTPATQMPENDIFSTFSDELF